MHEPRWPAKEDRWWLRGLTADVEDSSPTARTHGRQGLLNEIDRCLKIHFEHCMTRRQIDGAGRRVGRNRRGIVYENIDGAKVLGRPGDQALPSHRVREIGLNRRSPS